VTRRVIDLDAPGCFVVGRDADDADAPFYLQAVHGSRVVSVLLERHQVALLGERMLLVLGELERRGLMAIEVTPPTCTDGRLPYPAHEEFRVGMLTIAWDNDSSRVVVEAMAVVPEAGAGESAPPPGPAPGSEDPDEDDDPMGPDVLRLRLSPAMAQRFARQARRVAG
jgi:uncharacterized repeat protein (TIGR03847 family)